LPTHKLDVYLRMAPYFEQLQISNKDSGIIIYNIKIGNSRIIYKYCDGYKLIVNHSNIELCKRLENILDKLGIMDNEVIVLTNYK
jgi:hypothetical protein